jgi:hypothetical protein
MYEQRDVLDDINQKLQQITDIDFQVASAEVEQFRHRVRGLAQADAVSERDDGKSQHAASRGVTVDQESLLPYGSTIGEESLLPSMELGI